MQFGSLTNRQNIDRKFNQLRLQSRHELLSQIYGSTATTEKAQQNIEADLTQAFCYLLQNYDFDKNHPIVQQVAYLFRVDLDSVRQMEPKDRGTLLQEKIMGQIEQATKIIDRSGAEKELSTSSRKITKSGSHFEWLAVHCKYSGLRPIFEEILLQKVKLFDKELTQLTQLSSEQTFQNLDLATTAREGMDLRKTQAVQALRGRTASVRQLKVQGSIGNEFTNVKIRDKSQFLLGKWSRLQEDEFQAKKAKFKSNLKINNVPVLFQFVKKYTETVKARDNIYRKWEQRQKLGITPEELRYLCATSVFLNNTLAKSEKTRIRQNIRNAGPALVSRLEHNIAEKIIETYRQLMKRVADMRAKYYQQLTLERKLEQNQSASVEQSSLKQQQKKQFFMKYKAIFQRIVNGEKMKIRLNARVFSWVELFIKKLKCVVGRKTTKGHSQALLKRLTAPAAETTPLYKMKMKYPSSRIIKREDQYSHRLKYRQYIPSERFKYSQPLEESIRALNSTKLKPAHRVAFMQQLTGGPRQQPDFITVDLSKKKVYLSSPSIIKKIIKIQAKWKAVYQRKKFRELIEQVRERRRVAFEYKVASLYELYPSERHIDLKAIESRLKRVNMKITNIIKPYIRNIRRPINVFTSFCVTKTSSLELKNKYARNGSIRLGQFAKMVESDQFPLLKRSGIVVTSKEINQCCMANATSPMWWAVYHGNLELATLFLQGGGDPNSKDADDNSCLHLAFKNGAIPIIFQLLDYGGDLNCKNSKKATPLYHATKRMLKLLGLEEGSVVGVERDNNSLFYRRSNHLDHLYNDCLS